MADLRPFSLVSPRSAPLRRVDAEVDMPQGILKIGGMFLIEMKGNRIQRWAKYGAFVGVASWAMRRFGGNSGIENIPYEGRTAFEIGIFFGSLIGGIMLFAFCALIVNLFAKEK